MRRPPVAAAGFRGAFPSTNLGLHWSNRINCDPGQWLKKARLTRSTLAVYIIRFCHDFWPKSAFHHLMCE